MRGEWVVPTEWKQLWEGRKIRVPWPTDALPDPKAPIPKRAGYCTGGRYAQIGDYRLEIPALRACEVWKD